MQELLAKLKELDPRTYELIPPTDFPGEVMLAWLQAILQSAISARIDHQAEKTSDTWGYRLICDRDGHVAYVWKDWEDCQIFRADTAAEALLEAYVMTLERMGETIA